MIIHSLICTLSDEHNQKYRHATLSSKPSVSKLTEIYEHNIQTLQYILNYCIEHSIYSYRVPTFLFPLATHPDYKKWTYSLCHELLKNINWKKYQDITITNHPEQFIVLNSTNPNVVQNSIEEIHFWTDVCSPMPTKLFNLHIGSKSDPIENKKILHQAFSKLSQNAKKILSFENDEKSYNALDVLSMCRELDVMMVLDFHHERCWQKKKNPDLSPYSWDESMYALIPEIIQTYKNTAPLFHISSPAGSWNGTFMEQCKHADYIDLLDYPIGLKQYSIDQKIILDIEAKKKELAIKKLETINDPRT